jgi:hypothetical protein
VRSPYKPTLTTSRTYINNKCQYEHRTIRVYIKPPAKTNAMRGRVVVDRTARVCGGASHRLSRSSSTELLGSAAGPLIDSHDLVVRIIFASTTR